MKTKKLDEMYMITKLAVKYKCSLPKSHFFLLLMDAGKSQYDNVVDEIIDIISDNKDLSVSFIEGYMDYFKWLNRPIMEDR